MARLTLEQVSRESKNREAAAITSLQLSLWALSDVSCLSKFQNLERLDLGRNCLTTLESLSLCINLKWLCVVENKLESLKGVEELSKLTVLNAGKNKLRTMNEIRSITSLRALILNDNNISSICKLDQLKDLNTLVLSRNPIHEIGDSLMKVKSISKLSLSHCQIQDIGSSLVQCLELKEVRLAHNNITAVPTELACNIKLQNLDLGNNLIENWSELKVLSALHNLKNFNLQGNPIAENVKLAKKVTKLLPNLRIFNAKPIERSSRNEIMYAEEGTHHHKENLPLYNATEIQAVQEGKRKKLKSDAKVVAKAVLKNSIEEDYAIPKSNSVEVEEMKRDELQSNLKSKKNNSGKTNGDKSFHDATDVKVPKELKRKKLFDKEENKSEGVDDVEKPFMDLIVLDKDSREPDASKKDHEKLLGGLVVNHLKKRKRVKHKFSGQSALQLLSPIPEVGTGGLSKWAD